MPRPRTKVNFRSFQVYYPKKSRKTAIGILKLLAKNSPSVLSIKQISERLGSNRNAYPHKRTKSVLEELLKLDYCVEYGKISNPDKKCKSCSMSGKYLVEKTKLDQAVFIQKENTREYPKYEHEPSFDRSQWFICEDGFVLGKSIRDMKCFECNQTVGTHGTEIKYKIHDKERYWSLSDNGIVVMLTLLNNRELVAFYSKNPMHRIIECINILIKNNQKEWVKVLIDQLKNHVKINPNTATIANNWLYEQYQKHEFFSGYRDYFSARSVLNRY